MRAFLSASRPADLVDCRVARGGIPRGRPARWRGG